MATSNTYQNSITDQYIRDLLECPVCMETIKSVPVYQCANGHVICKICIEKLNNCPICRNVSALVRSLKLENIVEKLEGIQPEKMGPTTAKPKWGNGSVRSYGTISGPNQVASIPANPRQATPRQATARQATTPRQATPRQTTVVINNQDDGAQRNCLRVFCDCCKCFCIIFFTPIAGIILLCAIIFCSYLLACFIALISSYIIPGVNCQNCPNLYWC